MRHFPAFATVAGALALAFWPEAARAAPQVPAGFSVSVYAEGFSGPRMMALAANGDVFVSDMDAGTVLILRDANGDGKADPPFTFASGLQAPHGLAFHGDHLYVAAENVVMRFQYAAGDTVARSPGEVLVELPVGGHATRSLAFGPDGRMYVSVGSTGNANEETDPRRAAVWVYDADGKNGRLYASGLRNAVGLTFVGNELYATNNGQDHLGDDLPRDTVFKLVDGGFYGWPYCYVTGTGEAQKWDESFGRQSPALCDTAQRPIATFTAHSAPLGIAPVGNKLAVALHGSWARSEKTGYKVVMVDPATGTVEDFLTGFLTDGVVSGRPVDILSVTYNSGPHAILVSDDGAGRIWRIVPAS